jgi:hypothetical protein
MWRLAGVKFAHKTDFDNLFGKTSPRGHLFTSLILGSLHKLGA